MSPGQELPSPPASTAELPVAAVTIWNRSGDLLMHECDQTAFRRQVQQRIAEWNRGGPAFSVLLVQVDGCGPMIKTHGPSTVELAVRATRLFLSARLREMDVFDRYGEHSFALLLPGTSLDNAAVLAQRVWSNAAECLLPTKHGPLEVTRSLGIAEVSAGDDEASLLGRAEAALQAAGCNRVCCHDGRTTRPLPPMPAQTRT
jgi:diguanylate cyclase (GGDEF)-like protein